MARGAGIPSPKQFIMMGLVVVAWMAIVNRVAFLRSAVGGA
jgi:hypothetical protein